MCIRDSYERYLNEYGMTAMEARLLSDSFEKAELLDEMCIRDRRGRPGNRLDVPGHGHGYRRHGARTVRLYRRLRL